MKIATITFHGAHNYGSVLQAYALQKKLINKGHECEIINFRTDNQKDIYNIFTKRKGVKYILKNGYSLLTYSERKKKHDKFEDFINNNLILTTKEYRTEEELKHIEKDFDVFICGSDQIWNLETNDFEKAYLLPFVKEKNKVSYAPSCGPTTKFSDESKELAKRHIKVFNNISVRDKDTYDLMKELGCNNISLVLDPTLLLSQNEWTQLIKDTSAPTKDYIFMYSLYTSDEIMKITKKLSKELGLPVIISNITNQRDIFSGFEKISNSGPLDFLALIKNAKYVVTTSYHATIFSIIFEKPFLSVRAMEDSRFKYLLSLFELERRSVTLEDMDEKIKMIKEIEFKKVNILIEQHKEASCKFLYKSIGDEDASNL